MSGLKDVCAEMTDAAASEGATDAVAQAFESTTHQVRFSSSEIDALNSWSERHAILFVAVGKRAIASDIRLLNNPRESARAVVAAAKSTPPSKGYGGIASGRFKYRRARVDGQIVSLRDPSRFVHDAIRAAESEGAVNVGGTLYVRHERRAVASSGGAMAEDESASLDLSVRAFCQPEASGHAVSCATSLSRLGAAETGAKAGRFAKMAKDPVQGEEGRFDLVIEPLFLGGIMHPTVDMLSAMRVEINTSTFAKKIGKRVASDQVTLVDDPTVDSTSRRSFDHEGVPTRRNVLIKDGMLKTYLHSSSTAKRFRTKTTANAGPMIATLFSLAMQPVAFHPVVASGDWKEDELVEETEHGLYLNNTWYTRFQNYAEGDFSSIPRDALLRIENGEVVGAVKNIRVSDNLLSFWKGVDAISRRSMDVYWWDEARPPSTLPWTRVRGMRITRSS